MWREGEETWVGDVERSGVVGVDGGVGRRRESGDAADGRFARLRRRVHRHRRRRRLRRDVVVDVRDETSRAERRRPLFRQVELTAHAAVNDDGAPTLRPNVRSR